MEQLLTTFFADISAVCGHEKNYHANFCHHLLQSGLPVGGFAREWRLGDGPVDVVLMAKHHADGWHMAGTPQVAMEFKGGAYGTRNALKEEINADGHCSDLDKLLEYRKRGVECWFICVDITELGVSLSTQARRRVAAHCASYQVNFAYYAQGETCFWLQQDGQERTVPLPQRIPVSHPSSQWTSALALLPDMLRCVHTNEDTHVSMLYHALQRVGFQSNQISLETYFKCAGGASRMQEGFCGFLLQNGKAQRTREAYPRLIDVISKHSGQNVFEIADVSQLRPLVARYDSGGADYGIGNLEHGGPRAAIKQYLAYLQKNSYERFDADEDGYLDWLAAHPDGFVLNSHTKPRQDYQVLHRASCPTIADKIGAGYIKICAKQMVGIQEWLTENGFEAASSTHKCPQDNQAGAVDEPPPGHEPKDMQTPLNQILYGPPGTGKTYHTVNEALAILDPGFLEANASDRAALKAHFDSLVTAERIRFVTFHQSFSYEDFVEGLRAMTNDDKQLEYIVEPGVFKRLCDDARMQRATTETGIRSNPRIWKISINGTGPSPTKTYCLQHGEARIGWGKTGDLHQVEVQNDYYQSLGSGDRGTLEYFANEIAPGDILLCIESAELIGAIGVVTGDYRYEPTAPAGIRSDYQHVRPVKWLYRDLRLSILPLNDNKQFTLKTVYSMDRFSWGDLLAHLEQSNAVPEQEMTVRQDAQPYVLVIDEINRGNISRIFGELITLIEPSKRAGADEALTVTLPYSKKPFGVPSNVYLLGTMNTADRSLAGLDIALRRRFTFKEMPPTPALLDPLTVDGVNIGKLLRAMNDRIEVLLDRDHCIGHAYFLPLAAVLANGSPGLDKLSFIFRQQVIPLLQEYFFEDWERIAWVLNDHMKPEEQRFILAAKSNLTSLFGADVAGKLNNADHRWRINDDAFGDIESYRGIIGASA